jgi:hypothetical protein
MEGALTGQYLGQEVMAEGGTVWGDGGRRNYLG